MPRLITKYIIDLVLWVSVTPLAFWLRLEDRWVAYADVLWMSTLVGLPVKAIAIYWLGLYRRSWHKLGIRDLSALLIGVVGVTLLLTAPFQLGLYGWPIPRSVPPIASLLALFFMGGARLATRLWYERKGVIEARRKDKVRNVLIVGAGEAGTMIAREMLRHTWDGRQPVGFLDDDPSKQRQRFLGLPVYGKIEALPDVVKKHGIDKVLIAMPSASGRDIRRVVELAQHAKVEYRIIPGIYELLNGKVTVSQIREVDVVDLLGREPVRLETDRIADYLTGKTVLVTGAGGSIGSEIVRQVARFSPQSLVLLGRGENSIFNIDREIRRSFPELVHHAVIADVRDYPSLERVFERFRPEVVFHAAAHKHVPLMESNPEQAIFNNVGGTRNLAELALTTGVERFVNVSTDKAVNPTSIMGASKRVAELVVYQASQACDDGQAFVSVRFGNVLGSRGSVIPIFKEQIRRGGPVTVTHPDMLRYFMTIPEAAQLVLQAGSMADNGAVYVLDMGEPVRIVDLARDLIRLSGLEPEQDIRIEFTGIRPGEKLFEELLTAEEGTVASRHEKIFVARRNGLPEGENFDQLLDDLFHAATHESPDDIRTALSHLIPTHHLHAASEQLAVNS